MLRVTKLFKNKDRPGPRRRAIGAICGGIFLLNISAVPLIAQSADTPLANAQGIGTVREVSGTGSLGRQEPLPIMQPGMDIFTGDRARTEADSRAHLGFGTATQVFLGPESELIVDAFIAGSGGVIYLDGALLFDRTEGSADPEAEVVTDYGRIGVRGTRFFVARAEVGLEVFVARGAVSVVGNDPARTTVILTAGEGTQIPIPGAAPDPVRPWGEARIAAITRRVLGEGAP